MLIDILLFVVVWCGVLLLAYTLGRHLDTLKPINRGPWRDEP